MCQEENLPRFLLYVGNSRLFFRQQFSAEALNFEVPALYVVLEELNLSACFTQISN